jgi:hypothetical protein
VAEFKEYKLTDPETGQSLTVSLPRQPTNEEVDELFTEYAQRSTDNLTKGPKVKKIDIPRDYKLFANPTSVMMPAPSYSSKVEVEDRKDFYTKNIAGSLRIPQEDFDYTEGAPFALRAKLDPLRNMNERMIMLRREFGEENVVARNISGENRIIYKDPKVGKWRLYDAASFEPISDFVADLAGDAVPIVVGTVAGIKTYAATGGPAGTVGTAGGNVLLSAIAGQAAEQTVGAAQDALFRGIYNLDIMPGEIANHRLHEFALNTAVEFGTFKLGSLIPSLRFAPEGADQVNKDAVAMLEDMKGEGIIKTVPNAVRYGDTEGIRLDVTKMRELATEYPQSNSATFFEKSRLYASDLIKEDFGYTKFTKEASDDILKDGFESYTKMYSDQITKLNKAISDIDAEIKILKDAEITSAKTQAKLKAKELYRQNLEKKAKNFLIDGPVSPEQAGQEIRKYIARNYVEREVAKNRLYDEAYLLLDNDANGLVDVSRIARAFQGVTDSAFQDMEGQIVEAVANNATRQSSRVATSLDDLAGEKMQFKQLVEIIQDLESKVKRTSALGDPNSTKYKQLVSQLTVIRDNTLKQASPESRRAYEKANDFYMKSVLPLREDRIFNQLQTTRNTNFSEAIDKANRGVEYKLPSFKNGGTDVIEQAFSSPKALQDFIDATNNNPEARKILRQYWLSQRNLVAGRPINKANLNFSEKDLDFANILWRGQNNSFSSKVKKLKELQSIKYGEDEFIEGVTKENFDKLMLEGNNVNRNIQNLLEEDVALKNELMELEGNILMKLMAKNELPAFDNLVAMEDFIDSVVFKGNQKDLDDFIQMIQKERPEMYESFKLATFNHLVRHSDGLNREMAQKAGNQTLWNPEKMNNRLEAYATKYKTILGEERYNQILKNNKNLGVFSVNKATGKPLNVSVAAGGSGKPTTFVSGISKFVSDKYSTLMLNADMAFPTYKKFVTQDVYDDMMQKAAKATYMGFKGIRALNETADTDNEFAREMKKTYAENFSILDGLTDVE